MIATVAPPPRHSTSGAILAQARVAFRLHRFVLLAVAGMVLVASAAALVVAAALRDAAPTICAGSWQSCQGYTSRFDQIDSWAGPLMGILGGVAPIGGLFAGGGLVAREIEDRTAPLAWSLSPSRTRWLFGRVAPVAAVLLVLFAIAAIAATELERARYPGIDPLLSFYGESSRGLELVAIGFLVFAGAVLSGSIVGRVMPSLILAAVLGLALTVGAFAAEAAWIPSQAVIVDAETGASYKGAFYIDQLVRLQTGELIPTQDVVFEEDANGNLTGRLAGSKIEAHLVPGERHPFVEAVDSAGMLAAAGALLVLTGFVVRRRRPY